MPSFSKFMSVLLWLNMSVLAQEPSRNYLPLEIIDTALEYRQFDKVEITGSLITAPQARGILPVQVISRQEIERSSASSLPQLLQALPGMFNFQDLGNMTGTKEGGPETTAIHGNAAGTLVLLNGRRLPTYGNQSIFLDRTMVDMNIVPLSAIERIEILPDGASSRYGSDAVAGVVNIITKTSTKGLGISTEYTRPAGGLATGKMVNLSWGTGPVDERNLRFQIHFSAEQQKSLLAGDVLNASQGAIPFNVNGQTYWANGHVTQHGWPASLESGGSTVLPSQQAIGHCPDHWYTVTADDTTCWRNSQRELTLYPATQKQLLFVDGGIAINPAWRGFAQLIVGRQEQNSVPSDGLETSLDMGNGQMALVNTSPQGVVRQRYSNSNHQFLIGAQGDVDDWDIRTSLSTGQHRVERVYTDGLPISFAAFKQVPFTLEDLNQVEGQFSAELIARYNAIKRKTWLLDEGHTQLHALNVLASKNVAETTHGPVSLGLGWEWRQESVAYQAPTSPSRPGFSGGRQNWSTYAELQAPLSARQDMTVALRHDQYSDFGSVQTGKIGWRWRPAKGLLVRSAVGTGFRAPTISQMQAISSAIYDYPDTQTEQLLKVRNSGNPFLLPEKSTQATLGFRWEPNARWSAGADFWKLHIHDTFGAYSELDVLNSETLRQQYITTENGITYLNLPNLNLGRSERQGIDYDIQWREPTDIGRVRITWHGSWNLQARKQSVNGGVFESELGTYASNTQSYTPRHQSTLSTRLEQAQWSLFASIHYRSGFVNPMELSSAIEGPSVKVIAHIPAYWTVDTGARWQPDRAWTLSAHILNVTNRYPALMNVASSYFAGVDTRFANYYGRTLKLKAEYKF